MKQCNICQETKDYADFYNSKANKDGKQNRCKSCDNAASVKHKAKDYDRYLANSRRRQLKYKYDMTPEDYENRLIDQNFCCAICGLHISENKGPGPRNGSKRFCVDHNHDTGAIRGLLCNDCNRGLGLMGDTKEKLQKALAYLETH